MLVLLEAREAGCFREVAVSYSDHYRQVPLYSGCKLGDTILQLVTEDMDGYCAQLLCDMCPLLFSQEVVAKGALVWLCTFCHAADSCCGIAHTTWL